MKKVILLLVLILLISLGFSFAAVPCKINYQGRLIKDNVPVHNPTGVPMVFNVDGEQVYSGNVPVYNGLFRVVLDLEDKGIDWTAGETKYLEVIVDGEQLSPSEPLYAYPYAINSHLLEGATKEYFLNISGETQKKDGGLNIMGNVGIGTASPGAKLHIGGTAGTDGIMFPDGTVQTTATAGFGSWTDKDSANNPLVVNVVYRVTSDGFLQAFIPQGGGSGPLILKTDSNNPPSTIRDVQTGFHTEDPRKSTSVFSPIRKNDYVKVESISGNPVIYWLPIGGGACVK